MEKQFKGNFKAAAVWVVALVLITMLASSCRSNKTAVNAGGEDKVGKEFMKDKYMSDERCLRYWVTEQASRLSAAKSTTLIRAQAGLAQLAQKEVEGMATAYFDSYYGSDGEDNSNHDRYLFDGYVKVNLPETRIVAEEFEFNKSTGRYTYGMVVEIDRKGLTEEAVRALKSDTRVRNEFNEAEFRKFVEQRRKERREFEKENNEASK